MNHSRLYPNREQLNSLKNPLTEGEKYFIDFLDKYLPRDNDWTSDKKLSEYKGWLIFAQPFLNGSRPDVVVYHPFVGMIIYEVKDWDAKHYSWNTTNNEEDEKPTRLFVFDGQKKHRVKRPDKQVEHYKEKIIGQLVPIIGEAIDANRNNFGLIKTGLYFHNCSTIKAKEVFGVPIKPENFKYFPVIGRDALVPELLSSIIPDIERTSSMFWKREWNDELLFWLIPPFHSLEQGIPLTLKGNQFKVAEPKSGHYRVRGVAGSGKTQALAYRAGKLASEGKNVLIISFNITLWHYIKDMIQRSPFNFSWGQFTFSHFHGFCKDKLNEFDKNWPTSPKRNDYSSQSEYELALEGFFKSTVPNAVMSAVEGEKYDHYDAILIDEGQDYHFEWYNLLNDYFLTSRDEVVVVCDKKQNIYERELDWLDKRVTRQGLEKFKEPYIDLLASYRLPPKVATMSNEFSEMFDLNQELKLARVDDNPVLFHSQHIVWLNIENDKWLEFVHNAYRRLTKEGYNPTDIVILLPNHTIGQECVEHFKGLNIEANHVFETDSEATFHPHKKAFWMGDARLKMSTIHSFKGWELLNIVIFIPERAPESNKKLDAIVYTAITRTRENLIILNANKRYNAFGSKFPKKWDEQ